MNKRFLVTGTMVLALLMPAAAAPNPTSGLPEDAKWFFHLDVKALRDTKLGSFVVSTLLEKNKEQIAQLKEQMKFDAGALLQQVTSLTAYGAEYALGQEIKGVLILNVEEQAQKIIQGFLAAQALASTEGQVTELQQEPYSIYSFTEFFVAPVAGGPVILSKSRKDLEKAQATLAGAPGAKHARFTTFSEVAGSFFFLGVAEGFANNTNMPPQARILQMTEGGRVALGERGDRLFLAVDLKSKSNEVTRQIHQVIEGMLALFSLAQTENQDLLELARSIKVSSSERLVTLKADYPVAKVISRFAPEQK